MTEPKWKRFEKLIAKIQAELAPSATVVHNDKIPGRKSGSDRQIDVSIRQTVGQFTLLIVIDCKDYNKPVDVTGVGQFIDLVEDVGANKGAMVSSRGFSKAAIRRATDAGIDLFRLVDAESEDWRAYIKAPLLWHFRVLKGCAFSFSPGWPFLADLEGLESVELHDGDGRPIGTPKSLVVRRWNADVLPTEAGTHEHLALHEGPAFLKHEGRFFPVAVEAEIEVEHETYFGHVPLTKIQGFQNVVTEGVITLGFTTAFISADEIRSTWRRLTPQGALAPTVVLEVDSIVQSKES